MIALLGTVLNQARTHLNDDEGINWPDQKLIPKAQQAFNHMQADLLLAGIPIINAVSAIITVPSISIDDNNVDLSTITGYPTDMIMPIWMKERRVGETQSDFSDMIEVEFIPQLQLTDSLTYWAWQKQTIILRGSTSAQQVMLQYQRLLPLPGTNMDSTVVVFGELYLSYKVAAIAAFSSRNMDLANTLNAIAETNLDKIVRMNIKQLQNMPAKRRPYHRGRAWYGGFGSM